MHGLIGRHDDHDGRHLGALRFEFFLHAHKVLPGNGFERIHRPAIALRIGNHHQHFPPQLTQLKAVRFEMLEFGCNGILTAHQSHQQPGIRPLAGPPRPEGFEVALEIHAAGHDGLGIRTQHLDLVMSTAHRLMQPGLRRRTGGLGIVIMRELPGKGALWAMGVERHGL